jgi:ribosomal protein S18 acetylase RimI-like enzyme
MIVYTDSLEGITPAHLAGGFFAGWPNPPSPETHLRLLRNSTHIVLARQDETGPVVGYVCALSDHVLFAYLSSLEVLPAFQRQGIGRDLVRRMQAKLADLYAIDLLCDPDRQPFYARCGLQPAVGMCARNYARQSGQGITEGSAG